METLYRKVEIKSEADLPKIQDYYTVHFSNSQIKKTDCLLWTDIQIVNPSQWNVVDWYLQPVEPEEVIKRNLVYTLTCDKCKKPYSSADAFPEDQLCNKCFAEKYLKHNIEQKQTAEECQSEIKRIIQCCFESDIESWTYKFLQSHIDGTYEDIMNEINAQNQQPEISVTDQDIYDYADKNVLEELMDKDIQYWHSFVDGMKAMRDYKIKQNGQSK